MQQDLQTSRTAMNWAHTMLKASNRCKTNEEQQAFWNYIINPADVEDIPPVKLTPIEHPKCDVIPEREVVKVTRVIEDDDEKSGTIEKEIELKNTVSKNASISTILVEPLPDCVD